MTVRVLLMMLATWLGGQAPSTLLADEETYRLEHKLQEGERLRYRVVHMAKTNVRINQKEELTNVHSTSVKAWDVKGVSADGSISFDHGIESVCMTQQTGDEAEVRWDSRGTEIPPARFGSVAEKLGQVLGTVTISPAGKVLERSDKGSEALKLGMGEIVVPLPSEPVKIGGQWSVPREIRIQSEAAGPKLVKIRELYTLEKVQSGVATISVRSEPLTPVEESSEQAQLLQQLSYGTIRFDLDRGRLLSRQLDWDSNLVGFKGAKSNMEYRARLTEELEATNPSTAALKARELR